MNNNTTFIALTPLNEQLLCQQLEELRVNLPLDIYVRIKAVLDRCLACHRIYSWEIEQILALLENPDSPDFCMDDEEEESHRNAQAVSQPPPSQNMTDDPTQIGFLFYQSVFWSMKRTLKIWKNQCENKNPNTFQKYLSR